MKKLVLILSVFAFISCTKEKVTKIDVDLGSKVLLRESSREFNSDLINNIIHDDAFISMMSINNEIFHFSDTIYHTWHSNEEMILFNKDLQASDANYENILTDFGVHNAAGLLTLFENYQDKMKEVLTTNRSFDGLDSTEMVNLFSTALNIYLSENQTSYDARDACSEAYAAGMENCDDNFAWQAGLSVVTGVISGILATPVAGIGAGSLAMGTAYGNEIICRRGVVAAWRICRNYARHPEEVQSEIENLPYVIVNLTPSEICSNP